MIDLLADGRLNLQHGEWSLNNYLEVQKGEPFTIFESEHEPGLVAWPALWQQADGSLRLVVTEVQGDACDWPPRYTFGAKGHRAVQRYLGSDDGGQTWTDLGWQEENDPLWLVNSDPHCVRILTQSDGSLIRICHSCDPKIKHSQTHVAFDADLEAGGHHPFRSLPDSKVDIYPEFFTVQESQDGGRSWETVFTRNGVAEIDREAVEKSTEPGVRLNGDWWATGSRILEDGSIAWIGRSVERDSTGSARTVLSIAESADHGRSWSKPVPLLRNRGLFQSMALTEEADFVPLGEGRYLALVRTDTLGHGVQMVLKREEAGRWAMESWSYSMVPHSGFPFLLKCSDGTILHQGLGGHWGTIDQGKSWTFHDTLECYYGQMAEVAPGRVLVVTQVNAGDEPYPHRYDAFLRGCFLTHRKCKELRQNDSSTEMAFATTDELSRDGHLIAKIQVGGSAGLIARANADRSSYYALSVQCGADAERFPGAAPPKSSRLIISLCRVTDGKLAVLAQRSCEGTVGTGDWIDAQLSVRGDELKAAVRVNDGRATYLGARDTNLDSGSWGLFSDLSRAVFRQVQAIREPTLIRKHWDNLV